MKRLVFDLGMNNGDDTEYYLAKGYTVVAVEANPHLCQLANFRFEDAIANGMLKILNFAITDDNKDCIFYVNNENHQWSSLDITWAARNGMNVTPCPVQGTTIPWIVDNYGMPHFLKTDIEGGDITVLRQLLDSSLIPQFLSIEDCRFGYDYIDLLYKIGYRRFKLSDQSLVPFMQDLSVQHVFSLGSSGMFGDQLPGVWLDRDSFFIFYESTVRNRESLIRIAPPNVWWDIHCSVESSSDI
jgi:FkbM family methyltransferase